MILKKLLLIVLWFLSFTLCTHAEIMNEPFRNTLPSEQTEMEIKSLAEETSASPSLRLAPDEGGWAQKEIPLTDIDFSVFILLATFTSMYLANHLIRVKKQEKILKNK